jgi:hypothetical protein
MTIGPTIFIETSAQRSDCSEPQVYDENFLIQYCSDGTNINREQTFIRDGEHKTICEEDICIQLSS